VEAVSKKKHKKDEPALARFVGKDKNGLKSEEQYRREAGEYLDRMFTNRFGRKPDQPPKPRWQRHLDKLQPDDEPDGT